MNISLDTTMGEILAAFPQAKIGLFQAFHIGGCKACSYELGETLGQVREKHRIRAELAEILEVVRKSGDVEAGLHLSVADLQAALREGVELRLLDARTIIDFEDGHLPGARFITVDLQFEALDEWPKDTVVVVYSNHGERSLARASHFKAYGLKNTRSLDGGIEAWRAAGGEVVTGLPTAP